MRHFIVSQPSFIGGVLLAAGSPVNEADLNGATPGSALIEVDEHGIPLDHANIATLRDLGVSLVPIMVAPVMPHAPNPTAPQSLPPHPVGAPFPAGTYLPAEGVQSNAAAAALADRVDQMADRASAATRSADARAEAPVRRSADAGNGEGGQGGSAEDDVLSASIPDLTTHLDTVNDLGQVQKLIDAETAGRNRTGALSALEARRAQLDQAG